MKYTILVLAALTFSSCATIFYGSKQKIQVNSHPEGARVYINGNDTKQTTPCEIKIKRRQAKTNFNNKNELVYTFKKENYNDQTYRDVSRFNNLVILDWIYYLVPGIIDVATGSTRLYSKQVNVDLHPKQTYYKTDTLIKKEIVYVNINTNKSNSYLFEKKSDVDINIPTFEEKNTNKFALIIGNEDYSSRQIELTSEINVDYARNDASAFKEYANNTLGIPTQNTTFLLDATTGQMNQAISKINLILKNTKGNAEVYIFYAGHGLPDEETKEAYLMPVDINGTNVRQGIKINDLYNKLTEYPSKKITVFLDACFSGGARNQGLLAARGVKIKPKENLLNGNLVVFTSSSGDQSSLPFKEKNHGLFTYFLLKKLQESKGNTNYKELSEYLIDNISLQSVLVNEKEQTHQTNISDSLIETWGDLNFK